MVFASVANVCVMLVIKELIVRVKMKHGKKVIVAQMIAVAHMLRVQLGSMDFA